MGRRETATSDLNQRKEISAWGDNFEVRKIFVSGMGLTGETVISRVWGWGIWFTGTAFAQNEGGDRFNS